jgi:PPOX class probable F420-dependent enzyme
MSTGSATDIAANVRGFLESPIAGVVTTLRRDGWPHSTVVWVDVDDHGVSFNTAVGRAKERHLRADPRVALAVVDPADAYRWVSLTGTAELAVEGADAQIDRLARKYLGKDEYPWRRPDQQRISVRISPTRVEAHGLGD